MASANTLSVLAVAQNSTACYNGIYGVCDSCDDFGSCICPPFWSGHSDELTMDRTRWGGIVYVCQVVDPVVKGLWALALAISCFSIAICIDGIFLSVRRAYSKGQPILGPRPRNILGLLTTSALAVICLGVIKLFSSEQLIGIDLAPSVCFFIQSSSDFYIGAQVICHLVAAAMNSQESTYGRTHINEAVSREVWQTHLHAGAGAAINAVPVLGAILTHRGYHSDGMLKCMLLTTHIGSVIIMAFGILRFWLRSQALLRSFARSLDALQASYVVGCGGSSIVESNKRLEMSPRGQEVKPKPVHLQALEEEIQQLVRVIKKFKGHSRKLTLQLTTSRVLLGSFCVVPYLWNKLVYLLPLNICLLRLALTLELAFKYSPRRPKSKRARRANAVTAASLSAIDPAFQV